MVFKNKRLKNTFKLKKGQRQAPPGDTKKVVIKV
jgi:hypothetical protein